MSRVATMERLIHGWNDSDVTGKLHAVLQETLTPSTSRNSSFDSHIPFTKIYGRYADLCQSHALSQDKIF